ncbi:GATA zinc finger domain-containing protein 14 isoform X2 [Leptopilina heterotoma]|uniref:GATA zinc finger domain-containing protein 14 isoform X2 n=1 Tax=Leptopilina heterotoma TaxID=63436 RepID=UPI001CA8F472|nr:GATA zinc finger domain-containing protein 14 isoform X2 [Leptopilina heterotoma]
MRKTSFDNPSNTRRNILSNSSYNYTSTVNKDADYKRLNYKSQESSSFLQKSVSADNVVVRTRGFKPSDRHDPAKRNFLEKLTSKILHFDMESGERTPINLQKLLTPATDGNEKTHVKNKKMFASSYFYAPSHPTVEDQVELARRISNSLSDVKNMKSKGQSMYVNRKKRSVKWIHEGNGTEEEDDSSTPLHKDKLSLKCLMNPCGKVLDINGIQALGEEVNIESFPSHPEKLFDIVRDLNNQRGRGAEIFAKRRKRSEKWVVDKEQPQTPTTPVYPKTPTYPTKQEFHEKTNYLNQSSVSPQTPLSSFDNKPFYNPFTVDLTTGNSNLQCAGQERQTRGNKNLENGVNRTTDVKKIYLREVAVGTESELPHEDCDQFLGKSKRMSFNNEDHQRSRAFVNTNGHQRHKSAFSNNSNHHSKSNGISNGSHHHHNHHVKANGHSYLYPKSNHYVKNNSRPSSNSTYNSRPNSNSHYNSNSKSKSKYYSHPTNSKFNSKTSNNYKKSSTCETNGKLIRNNFRNGNSEDSEESDYTPVPVKQLIQEFEKTCRPVLQYKQLSPKVIPISRQNDISRFFENTSVPSKYEVCCRLSSDREDEIFERESLDSCRSNGSLSSEELDDESLDDSLSSMNYYQFEGRKPICEENFQPIQKGNNRSASMSMVDEYYRRQIMDSDEDQEESLIISESSEFIEIQTEIQEERKPRVLAMVGTQDDILDTIKHLRNTPVVNNLVSADCEFGIGGLNVDDGGKLYDGIGYQGPKISSYQNLANYNTAPRGWDQSLSFYRPIKFEKPPEKLVYSDF